MREGEAGPIVRRSLAVGVVAVALVVPSAQAATIAPNTFLDDNTNNANCTLREAIISANGDTADDACTAGTGADEIALQAGTYELSVGPAGDDAAASGDLDVTDTDGLKITGAPAGSTVDANGIDRVFHTFGSGSATFDLLTITGGHLESPPNPDADGAGISIDGTGVVNLLRSTVSGNTAVGGDDGGGILLTDAGGKLNLTDSTISGNAAADGAGLDAHGNAEIVNSTISGNQATGPGTDDGGGLRTFAGVLTVSNSTISGNSADAGGGVLVDGMGSLSLKGTIVAGNSAPVGPDCGGPDPVTSQGHNLIQSTTGCTFVPQGTDVTGQDPLLGPLADNGGPTPTHALLSGSPAIDAGPPDAPPTDQRGAPRNPDIGAYELVTCLGVIVNRVGTAGTRPSPEPREVTASCCWRGMTRPRAWAATTRSAAPRATTP